MTEGMGPSSSAVDTVAADAPGLERTERWLLPALSAWFRLEVHGAVAALPDWGARPSIFVMNHTAILGVEVYLLYAALRRVRPELPRPRTTVWPPFLAMPGVGAFYRAGGCLPMSVAGASAALRAGHSVLVLPEGPDATDVRVQVGTFHAGFLRVVRAMAAEGRDVPVVPFGWAGVDEANPWWVTTRPGLWQLMRVMRASTSRCAAPPCCAIEGISWPGAYGLGGCLDDERHCAGVTRVRDRWWRCGRSTRLRETHRGLARRALWHTVARCPLAWARR